MKTVYRLRLTGAEVCQLVLTQALGVFRVELDIVQKIVESCKEQ